MKTREINIAKKHRPLSIEEISFELERQFPELNIIFFGEEKAGLIIKKSSFAGARINLQNNKIRLKGKVPELYASLVDYGTLGMISSFTHPPLIRELNDFLKNKFAR